MSHTVPDGPPSVRGERKTQRQSTPSDPPVLLWSDELIMTVHFLSIMRQTSFQSFISLMLKAMLNRNNHLKFTASVVQKEQARERKREQEREV